MSKEYIEKFHISPEFWQGKLTRLEEVCHPDMVYHVSPFPDLVGLEAFRQFVIAFHMAITDFHLEIVEELVQGDTSLHRWICQGTFSGQSPLMPTLPTGKVARVPGCSVVHWKNGKMAENWHYGDWLGFLQQFGVIPAFETAQP